MSKLSVSEQAGKTDLSLLFICVAAPEAQWKTVVSKLCEIILGSNNTCSSEYCTLN